MTSGKESLWKIIRHDGITFRSVGLAADGSLINPNGYPEETVRAAICGAIARRHERRSAAAKKGAITAARRRERKVRQAADKLVAQQKLGPRASCCICGRGLADAESIARGIGSECWSSVLSLIEMTLPKGGPKNSAAPPNSHPGRGD